MNERAIELYQAAFEFAYQTMGAEHAGLPHFQGAVAGKFAESLIKACAQIAADNPDSPSGAILTEFGVDE